MSSPRPEEKSMEMHHSDLVQRHGSPELGGYAVTTVHELIDGEPGKSGRAPSSR